jgi:DMSO reductase family type II enzyme heme b subunit
MTEPNLGSRKRSLIVVLAMLIVVASLVPLLASARPAREIPAPTVEEDLSSPDAAGWADVPASDVPLSAAPSGLPGAEQVSTRTVDVQAARSDSDLFIRLQWADADPSTTIDDPQTFVDAAAVQMPVNTSTQPAIAMGSARNMVNVWYWRADEQSEELAAGGPGSTTILSYEGVSTEATHEDGTWTVVYNRPLTPGDTNRTAITGEENLDIAFAVFNGSNMERSGHKAVSEWYYLPVGPDDGGAPFETILWAIAGLALAAVVLVTIQGVRRARDGSGGEGS